MRNSWGTHWGEQGFFRVVRGINNIAIESDCAWATPRDTWTNEVKHITTQAEKDDPKNDKYRKNGPYPESPIVAEKLSNKTRKYHNGCTVTKTDFVMGEKRPAQMSWE